ncbi:MAG: long-chain fatty acid--CoA ligase [Chloroflexi bacterium]|nr:long-chain fatty acid--CoA ligase [Chloroflexota bacterium]
MEKPWLQFYEPQVPPTLPYPHHPLHASLEESARKHPDATATIFMDARLTYAQLNALADRFAASLQRLGVQKGDRVGVYVANCPQFIVGYYGALKAGAIVAPFNPLYAAREVEHQLKDSGAEVMLVMSRFYPIVKGVRARTALKHVIVTNIKEYFPPLIKLLFTLAREKHEGDRQDISGEANTHWFQDLLRTAPAQPAPVEVHPEDTAVLLYTGGTTGVPKGAELTHANVLTNAVQCRHWMHDIQEAHEVVLTALPLYHSFGMTTCMNISTLTAGAMLLIPNPRDIPTLMKNINKHHPTIFPGVPTMYVAFNNFPDIHKYNVKSIRACISGAAGLPVEVQKRFEELTGGRLVEGYGLSEASPVTHGNPVYSGNKVGTIGLPFPDTEARIVDLETGTKDLPPGEIGELIIRGPQVMKGYWNMPKETEIALRDGWLYTGDIARMDEEGYFQIVDRKKDMIIAGGFNVYPRDVEEVLYQNPKVKEAVVAGVPDPYRGETVKAYIILKEGQTATAEEIIEFCKGKMAKYKVPTAVEFRKELPKTIVGKILRRMLVEEEKKKLADTAKT